MDRENKHRVSPKTTNRARQLRREATFPERLLWTRLRSGQLGDLRFRRQHAIEPYIADFCCPAVKLVIELDGITHEDREEYDVKRTRFLEALGYRVVRFTDDEVIQDLNGVVYRIACELGLEPWSSTVSNVRTPLWSPLSGGDG